MPNVHPDPNVTELLYRALAAPIGIAVRCDDAARAIFFINSTMRVLADDQLSRLQLRVNPLDPEFELFILKRAPSSTQTPATD